MTRLQELLSRPHPDMAMIAEFLDAVPPAVRKRQALSLGRLELRKLFRAAQGFRPITLADIVPEGTAPLIEVVHEGLNSLPAARRFAKVFCRPAPEVNGHGDRADGHGDGANGHGGSANGHGGSASGHGGSASGRRAELWGYNRNPALIETSVGPGYFVARQQNPHEVLIDYLTLPAGRAPGWPPILPNDARLSRFVYNNTQDLLRGVSKHVSIGAGYRGRYEEGNALPAWFVLVRDGK